jgi:pimeloyl-ACP methyl ester carboxylesterase
MPSRDTLFVNRNGRKLAGRIDQPDSGETIGYALLAHCFTCSKELGSLRRLARTIAEFGIGVLSFDFTGLGQSEGQFEETSFSSQASDLLDAFSYMKEEGMKPSVMIGHSLGGTATLYAAKELPDVRAVATIGAPADPAHVEGLFTAEVASIEEEGQALVSIGGRPFTIQRSFLEDIRNHPPEHWLAELKCDVMVLHSPLDNIVGIENAERIFKTIKHPKSFISLREADHLLSRTDDAAYAGRIIGAWAASILARKYDYKG